MEACLDDTLGDEDRDPSDAEIDTCEAAAMAAFRNNGGDEEEFARKKKQGAKKGCAKSMKACLKGSSDKKKLAKHKPKRHSSVPLAKARRNPTVFFIEQKEKVRAMTQWTR